MEILPHTRGLGEFCYRNLFLTTNDFNSSASFRWPFHMRQNIGAAFYGPLCLPRYFTMHKLFLQHLIWLLTLGRRFLSARVVKRNFYRRDIEFFILFGVTGNDEAAVTRLGSNVKRSGCNSIESPKTFSSEVSQKILAVHPDRGRLTGDQRVQSRQSRLYHVSQLSHETPEARMYRF